VTVKTFNILDLLDMLKSFKLLFNCNLVLSRPCSGYVSRTRSVFLKYNHLFIIKIECHFGVLELI